MEILQIVGLGIVAASFAVFLRNLRPEMALLVSLSAGMALILLAVPKISAVVSLISAYVNRTGVDPEYLSTILKIIGIAYITEFGAEICKDSGESAIASKIELGGKVIIIAMAVPIITSLIETITSIRP